MSVRKHQQLMPFFFYSRQKKEVTNICSEFNGMCPNRTEYEERIDKVIDEKICNDLVYSPGFDWITFPDKTN